MTYSYSKCSGTQNPDDVCLVSGKKAAMITVQPALESRMTGGSAHGTACDDSRTLTQSVSASSLQVLISEYVRLCFVGEAIRDHPRGKNCLVVTHVGFQNGGDAVVCPKRERAKQHRVARFQSIGVTQQKHRQQQKNRNSLLSYFACVVMVTMKRKPAQPPPSTHRYHNRLYREQLWSQQSMQNCTRYMTWQ